MGRIAPINSCLPKRQKTNNQDGAETPPAIRKPEKTHETSFLAKLEKIKKKKNLELISNVKAELMDISQKLDEKVKTGITDKDLLDIQLVADDLDLSYFYQNAYENEVLIKVVSDLKIVLVDLATYVQQPSAFKVDTPAKTLTKHVLEKQKLIQRIKQLREADRARSLLRTKVPESALTELNKRNFDTKEQEARLADMRKVFDDYDLGDF